MKNSQKGFVVPLLVAIIALLVIGGGVYVYENKKAEAPVLSVDTTQQSNQVQQQVNTQTLSSSAKPSITVVSPNGGEIYKKGDTVYIRWNTLNIDKKTLEIDLIKVDGTLVYNLGSLINPLKGSQIDQNGVTYSWVIPTDSSPGGRRIDSGQYKIRISLTGNSSIVDTSDNYFIVASSDETSSWKTYTNSNPAFSFSYPSSWNQPVMNQQSTTVFTDFGNGFSVTTGFYYDQVTGRNSTVLEIINGYKNSSTMKNVQTENIKVDGHLATKITYYNSDTKKNYTDVYIYQDQQIQEKFIELNVDNSVAATIFNQILSTFNFTK